MYYAKAALTVIQIDERIDYWEAATAKKQGALWFKFMRHVLKLKEERFEANNTIYYGK